MVCLPGKVIVIIASDVFVAITINIHNKVSFNIECFKNLIFLSFQYHLLFLEHN